MAVRSGSVASAGASTAARTATARPRQAVPHVVEEVGEPAVELAARRPMGAEAGRPQDLWHHIDQAGLAGEGQAS